MQHIVERIVEVHDGGPGVVAFDADGTLWSGDIGEDTFLGAIERQALRDEALSALQALARQFDLPQLTEANAQAAALFEAYRDERLPEIQACEMMAWAFAGWSYADLIAFTSDLLAAANLDERRYSTAHALIDWARSKALRTVIISASPDFAVAAATTTLGFTEKDIAACSPLQQEGVLQPSLKAPLPYAEHKVSALRRVEPDLRLVAAFGDNSFDLQLLQAAQVGVAVRPKPALRALISAASPLLTLED